MRTAMRILPIVALLMLVLAIVPASAQEMADFVYDAFDLADRYRNPVMILADGALRVELPRGVGHGSQKRGPPVPG